jgi:hypothetical protein
MFTDVSDERTGSISKVKVGEIVGDPVWIGFIGLTMGTSSGFL